jgi:hypothetical protein
MNYDNAADYWKKQDAVSKKADAKTIKNEAEKFIAERNTCALATGFGTKIRCTPIEYTYLNGCLWMMSEGGEKFRNLKENKNVSVSIFDSYSGFADLGGIQLSGEAQIIEPWTDEYINFLNFKKIPESALRNLNHQMYMIKIKPNHIDFLYSGFKKQGFSSRQQLEL